MSRYELEVSVRPRPGLLDPEGSAVQSALDSLGFPGLLEVRIGKVIDLELEAGSEGEAVERAQEMCRKLLANPVTEDFQIRLRGGEAGPVEAGALEESA